MDLEKFICSLIKYHKPITEIEICSALKDQGLEYKGGVIVEVGQEKETKFSTGDWIVTPNNQIKQIKSISFGNYRFTDGSLYNIIDVDNKGHIWTIEDAKDGDVLAYNDGSLTIFRYRLSGLDAGLYMSHVLLTDKIEFKQTCAINNVHPATKEQCDTLTKAMTEAGYIFDFEKKELKKTEPKFKVGDWVTDGVSRCQICFIDDTQYWYSENCILGSIESIDKRYRLWTIGDAKDGDVLCSEQMILLFKKWEYTDWSFVIAYAGIDVLGQLQITNEHWLISNHAHPATKEERNLLFQKMKEAGYEWDAEKKKLKKIEPKPADNRESSFLTAERAKEVSPFMRSGFENESVGWSKEEEEYMRYLNTLVDNTASYEYSKKVKCFLKSLIPQPKQEWNEEDEDLLKCTINNLTELEQRFGKDYGKVGKCINWIKQKRWKKSLKTADLENSLCDIQDGYSDTSYEYRVLGEAIEFIRSTDDPHAWRPSDEQITWLYRAADDASKDSRMKQILNELLSDLKKLREG